MASPPPWKAFSTAMPMPATLAPALPQISIKPVRAQPLARKSSMINTLSPGFKKRLPTMTGNSFFLVNE